MHHVRILLADAHPGLLRQLEGLLTLDFEHVAAVSNANALLEAAERWRPEVILLDVSLPPWGGFDAACRVRALLPASKLVFLSLHDDPGYAEKAGQVGASGLLLKQHPSEIVPFIRKILRGHDPSRGGSDCPHDR